MALAVPLSRFTSRVGGGSAFFVRRHYASFASRADIFGGSCAVGVWRHDFVGCWDFIQESRTDESWDFRICDRSDFELFTIGFDFDLFWLAEIIEIMEERVTMTPNKSPEPTAVGAVSSAVAVHVAGRRWLSFFC